MGLMGRCKACRACCVRPDAVCLGLLLCRGQMNVVEVEGAARILAERHFREWTGRIALIGINAGEKAGISGCSRIDGFCTQIRVSVHAD